MLFSNNILESEQHCYWNQVAEVIQIVDHYKISCTRMIKDLQLDFEGIPKHQQCLLPNYKRKIETMTSCILHNHMFLQSIISDYKDNTQKSSLELEDDKIEENKLELEQHFVRSILRQFAREWSKEGEGERKAYDFILDHLNLHYRADVRKNTNVLVPGSGLGRLAYEISKQGFNCQGNEHSLYMLLASEFILNKTSEMDQYEIYPYALQVSNIITPLHTLRTAIKVPDELPLEQLSGTNFSIVAGDFLSVYADQKESWDAIVTCFFIDTAHNVIQYLELIYRLLKKGGVWINLGPLLYHFENVKDKPSLELSWTEIKEICINMGFTIQTESFMETTYCQNAFSMLKSIYTVGFLVAIK